MRYVTPAREKVNSTNASSAPSRINRSWFWPPSQPRADPKHAHVIASRSAVFPAPLSPLRHAISNVDRSSGSGVPYDRKSLRTSFSGIIGDRPRR
jgi:hypothetical protein